MKIFKKIFNRIKHLAEVKLGMGATLVSDHICLPGTIIEIKNSKIIWQQDITKREEYHLLNEPHLFSYLPHDKNKKYSFTLRKNGRYVIKGHGDNSGWFLILNERIEKYH
jgi:hypothetical protein